MINLAYEDNGSGDPVLFIAGTGGAGRTWHIHQIPRFLSAGYRCVTFDNRGIGATEEAGDFTPEQMIADTAALIEDVIGGPTRIVAISMGAYIAQELMLTRPELVTQAVLMAPAAAWTAPANRSVPPTSSSPTPASSCRRPMRRKCVCWRTSHPRPSTTRRRSATGWRCSPPSRSSALPACAPSSRSTPKDNRLAAYRSITNEVLVIGFADDLLTPGRAGP